MNNSKRKYDDAIPVTDEGWWQSVLADEQRYAPPHPQHGNTPKSKPVVQEKPEKAEAAQAAEFAVPQADWTAIKDLYSNDRIIEMKVTGHNRGGLLVESDGLAGFVPFSHLIDLAGKEHEVNRDISLETYVGKVLNVKVIECVPEDGRVVFSERAALAEPVNAPNCFTTLQVENAHAESSPTSPILVCSLTSVVWKASFTSPNYRGDASLTRIRS